MVTGSGTIYLENPEQLEQLKKKKTVNILAIHRNKGLGEMSPQAWKYVMEKENYTEINVPLPQEAKKILEVCFGKDTDKRKNLLLDSKDEN